MSAPLILASNTITGGYEVANSLRFDDGSGDSLTRSQSSSPSSQRIFTFSAWVKRGNLNSGGSDPNMQFFSQYTNTANRMDLRFQSGDTIDFYHTSSLGRITTNRLFRDVSAWYHVVLRVDTTQATSSDRYRLYVNGVQETSFSTATYPSQNADLGTNFSTFSIGDDSYGTAHFDGYFAEVVYCDGQSLDPTSFGEFDEDTGIWKPIDVSGLTFGTNGFYLDFENSSSLGADVSGNGNNFTVNNLTSIDQCQDTPTNNYATIDVLSTNMFDSATTTFSEGNLKHVAGTGASFNGTWLSNIGVNSGKWYAEFKLGSHSTSSGHSFGIFRDSGSNRPTNDLNTSDLIRVIFADTSRVVQLFGTNVQTGLASVSSGDIFGVYMDIDNGKFMVQRNGSDYITQVTGITTSGYTWFFDTQGEVQSTRNLTFEHNYGNPSFSISSGNTDPNGYGNFEYSTTYDSVGYYALNTKNLAEFG